MPGIFGVLGGQDRNSQFCQQVTAAHDVPGLSFLQDRYTSGPCALLAIARDGSRDKYLANDVSSGAVLLWEGDVYGTIGVDGPSTCDASSIADSLLRAYAECGDRFVEKIDGEFNVAIYEENKLRLSLFSDRLGSYPLYFWHTPGGFYFGSEKKCVLATCNQTRRLDAVGLLQPFAHQHNLGDRTIIDGLKRMPPSSCVRIEAGRMNVRRYGVDLFKSLPAARSSQVLEAWQSRLESAVGKRIRREPRLLVSLSSGLDSRAVACALDRSYRPVSARTMGHPSSLEVRYAARIAEALRFNHVIEDSLAFNFSDVARQIVWRTDGETDFRNGLSLAGHRNARALGNDIMGGWLGDVTSGAHLRPFMLRPMTRDEFVSKVFRWYVQHTPRQLELVFRKEFLERYWPEVRQAFVESYLPYADLPNTTAHEMWDIRNRQTRMTVSSMPVDSHLFGKVRPFFDRDYLDFSMSIPLRWRLGQNLYKSLISQVGPEIRSIPNGNTNLRIHRSPTLNLFGYGLSLSKRLVSKLGAKATSRQKDTGSAKVAADMASHFRRDVELRSIINRFVSSDSFDDEVFNPTGIGELLKQHYTATADHSELVSILASYAIALNYFFHSTQPTWPSDALPIL